MLDAEGLAVARRSKMTPGMSITIVLERISGHVEDVTAGGKTDAEVKLQAGTGSP